MEYKDFISKLHIKGTWLPKDEFTKQLFESSVRDTSVITDKRNSINTFKGYNRGNPINEIAYDVINDSTNLKESGIEVFIEKYLNNHLIRSSSMHKRFVTNSKIKFRIFPVKIYVRRLLFFLLKKY